MFSEKVTFRHFRYLNQPTRYFSFFSLCQIAGLRIFHLSEIIIGVWKSASFVSLHLSCCSSHPYKYVIAQKSIEFVLLVVPTARNLNLKKKNGIAIFWWVYALSFLILVFFIIRGHESKQLIQINNDEKIVFFSTIYYFLITQ